ncbi:MAG: MFS transporter [Rhodospirillales bacterium]|nr:MFS transporter [Rhodospirillales bacterium]
MKLSRLFSDLSFMRDDPRLLAYGFLLTFFSTFGQTFFISLYATYIKAGFLLSNGEFGAAYSFGTLASAAALTWSGHWIDRLDLRLWTKLMIALFAVACLVMATAHNFITLVIAIFLLRQAGQGLMTHTAVTSQARYYDSARGRAVATAGLGFTLAESFFPALGVLLALALGWRETWFLFAAALIVIVLPLSLWLLRGHDQRHERYLAHDSGAAAKTPDTQDADYESGEMHAALSRPRRHWQRREVLGDRRFYVLLAVILAPPFIFTGLFFHQVQLAADKGWPITFWALTFVAFAGASLVGSVFSGIVIDRIGAIRILPFVLPPLGLGCLILSMSDGVWVAWTYMLLAGLTAGIISTFTGAFWAEAYGTRHLGAIRALATALMVFSSALSPVIMGLLIDIDVSMNTIAIACAGYCLVGTGVAVFSSRLYRRA